MQNDNVHNDNKLRQPHRKTVKRTVAPRQYAMTELRTRNLKMDLVALSPNAMERKQHPVSLLLLRLWCHLQHLAKLYRCDAPYTKNLHEDLDARLLRIKQMYGIGPNLNRKPSLQWL